MKILFVMQYPGYLRYFDSTLKLLAKRGHRVDVAFDLPRKQAEGLEAIREAAGIVDAGATPARKDLWQSLAAALRTTIDFVRYLHPRFRDARYLRERMETHLPVLLRPLSWIQTLGPSTLSILIKTLLMFERAIPSGARIEEFLRRFSPDLVLVTPLVTDGSTQVDILKSARALGIRTGLCVASWDHLTTKGLVRLTPDKVFVWNEHQKKEAEELHYIAPDKVVVTGAQPFDKWFRRTPSVPRETFCRKVGLSAVQPFVLFVGSTASISAPTAEFDFVKRWVQALRGGASPLRELGVLVRPHPYNMGAWAEADLSGWGNAAVWPRVGANPVNEDDRSEYFDSLHHSAAVVGINTSAMVEAAIAGRPVLTVLPAEFEDTQTGTLHFQYLLPENGGFLQVARSLEEHLGQLAEVMARNGAPDPAIARFVRTFVRPHGLDADATPRLVEGIEQVGRAPAPLPEKMPWGLYPARVGLWWAAWAMRGVRTMNPPPPKVKPLKIPVAAAIHER